VFGCRLAEGLNATTKAYIIIAGRSADSAARTARELGVAEAAVLDRETATVADILALRPDLVIDAAGPFQGADLRFARTVIEAGVHYIDLADARDFVAAFPSLDALARQHNVAAITGASSTPALTHAVLDQLRAGWRRVDVIRAGIAPANKMDRGLSVMRAILSWTGAPMQVFADGAWRERHGWSHCGSFDIPGLDRRRYALAETPDLDLLPARYAPRESALFMAGLELPMMQRGMEVMSVLRRRRFLQDPVRWADFLRRAGDLLLPFGSDRGGMMVEALGRDAHGRPVRACWSMVAANGLGPFTPTFAALALARRFASGEPLPVGARPCVAMLTLEDFEPEFKRHNFGIRTDITLLHSPFETALGVAFDAAPPAVRAVHRGGPVTRLRGEAKVQGASSPVAAIFARLFGMPAAAETVPIRVTMRLDADKEVWTRQFGDRRMESRLRFVAPGIVRESFGPFDFDMKVSVEQGVLAMTIVGWRIGPIPLPALLAPRSSATETEDEQGRFRFDVPIALPLIGRLTHYSGWLVQEEVEAAPAPSEKETA
jgi:hypothetical protein